MDLIFHIDMPCSTQSVHCPQLSSRKATPPQRTQQLRLWSRALVCSKTPRNHWSRCYSTTPAFDCPTRWPGFCGCPLLAHGTLARRTAWGCPGSWEGWSTFWRCRSLFMGILSRIWTSRQLSRSTCRLRSFWTAASRSRTSSERNPCGLWHCWRPWWCRGCRSARCWRRSRRTRTALSP